MKRSAINTACRAAIATTIACGIGLSSATTGQTTVVPYPEPKSPASRTPQEFSCAGKSLEFSREQLEKLAFGELDRRGVALHRGEFETTLKRRGCDWVIVVDLLPLRPGGTIGVVVDGLSGKVKEYMRGH